MGYRDVWMPGRVAEHRPMISARAALYLVLLEYNKNQPRDKNGRWSKTAANIRRGQAAMEYALKTQEDVPNAMYREEVGDISFVWGWEGNPDKGFAGGYGLSHIVARPDRNIMNVPTVIAKGVISGPYGHNKRDVTYKQFTVVLTRGGKGGLGTWVLTGFGSFHLDEKRILRWSRAG